MTDDPVDTLTSEEIREAKDTIIEALNMVHEIWKLKETPNEEAFVMTCKTHKLVIEYIDALLCEKQDQAIPLIGG